MAVPTRRTPGLSRRRILQAALALVDRAGAEALSMRRLAGELDVAAMSLYKHIDGREALLDGLAEVLVETIGVDPTGDDPRAKLTGFAKGIRAVAGAHPAAFQLVGMRPLHTPGAFATVDTTLGALREWGMDDVTAVHAYRALLSFARGFALAEIGGFTLEARAADSSLGQAEGLSLSSFPHVLGLAEQLAHPDRDAAFDFGLNALLAGLEPHGHLGP